MISYSFPDSIYADKKKSTPRSGVCAGFAGTAQPPKGAIILQWLFSQQYPRKKGVCLPIYFY
jgi:hypothetical protein